jgi:hypothetical protein
MRNDQVIKQSMMHGGCGQYRELGSTTFSKRDHRVLSLCTLFSGWKAVSWHKGVAARGELLQVCISFPLGWAVTHLQAWSSGHFRRLCCNHFLLCWKFILHWIHLLPSHWALCHCPQQTCPVSGMPAFCTFLLYLGEGSGKAFCFRGGHRTWQTKEVRVPGRRTVIVQSPSAACISYMHG